MGHVHLHVRDLEETQHFYHDIFGLGVKHQMGPSALFMASGDYHHHLGSNIWNGRRLPAPAAGQQGLAEVVWRVEDQVSLDQLADRLEANQVSYQREDQDLTLLDNSGIPVRVEY